LKTTLPYTENDLIKLVDTFNNYFLKTLVLNSTSLVGFPSNNFNSASQANKTAILDEVNTRIGNFINNDVYSDKSPLGNLPAATTVEYSIPQGEIDKSGDLKIDIFLKLKDGQKFMFDGINATEYIKTTMKIKIYPALNHDYEIDKLITITPYEISGQGYKDFSKK
jgi:hypothetical protein